MTDNGNALKHGAFSQSKKVLKLRRRRVQYTVRKLFEYRDQGIEPMASLLTDVDRPLVARWAWARDIADTLTGYLEEVGLIAGNKDGDLVIRSLEDKLGKWIDREAKLATMLGFTPASRFAMRVDALQGDDLALRAAKLRNGAGDTAKDMH